MLENEQQNPPNFILIKGGADTPFPETIPSTPFDSDDAGVIQFAQAKAVPQAETADVYAPLVIQALVAKRLTVLNQETSALDARKALVDLFGFESTVPAVNDALVYLASVPTHALVRFDLTMFLPATA